MVRYSCLTSPLSASPDGTVKGNAIVEMKIPLSTSLHKIFKTTPLQDLDPRHPPSTDLIDMPTASHQLQVAALDSLAIDPYRALLNQP